MKKPKSILTVLVLSSIIIASLVLTHQTLAQSPPTFDLKPEQKGLFEGLPESAQGLFDGLQQIYNGIFYGGLARQEGGAQPRPVEVAVPTPTGTPMPTPTPYIQVGDLIQLSAQVDRFACIADNPPDQLHPATCGITHSDCTGLEAYDPKSTPQLTRNNNQNPFTKKFPFVKPSSSNKLTSNKPQPAFSRVQNWIKKIFRQGEQLANRVISQIALGAKPVSAQEPTVCICPVYASENGRVTVKDEVGNPISGLIDRVIGPFMPVDIQITIYQPGDYITLYFEITWDSDGATETRGGYDFSCPCGPLTIHRTLPPGPSPTPGLPPSITPGPPPPFPSPPASPSTYPFPDPPDMPEAEYPWDIGECLYDPEEFNDDPSGMRIELEDNDCNPRLVAAPGGYNPFDKWDEDACDRDIPPNLACQYQVPAKNLLYPDTNPLTCNDDDPRGIGKRLIPNYPGGLDCGGTSMTAYIRKLNDRDCLFADPPWCSTCGQSDGPRCVSGTTEGCRKAIAVKTMETRHRTSARPPGSPEEGEACLPGDICLEGNDCYDPTHICGDVGNPVVHTTACLERRYIGREVSCGHDFNCGGYEYCPCSGPTDCYGTPCCGGCDDFTQTCANPWGYGSCDGHHCCCACNYHEDDKCEEVKTSVEELFSGDPIDGCGNDGVSDVCDTPGQSGCADVDKCCGIQDLRASPMKPDVEDCSYYEWTERQNEYMVVYESNRIDLSLDIQNLSGRQIPYDDPANTIRDCDDNPWIPCTESNGSYIFSPGGGDGADLLLEFDIPDFLDIKDVKLNEVSCDGFEPQEGWMYWISYPEVMTGIHQDLYGDCQQHIQLIPDQLPGFFQGCSDGYPSYKQICLTQGVLPASAIPGLTNENGCQKWIYEPEQPCGASVASHTPQPTRANPFCSPEYPVACHGGKVRIAFDFLPAGCQLKLNLVLVPSDIDAEGNSWYRDHELGSEELGYYTNRLVSDDRLVNINYEMVWPVSGARLFFWDSTAGFDQEPTSRVEELLSFWVGKGTVASASPGCGTGCFVNPDSRPFGWPVEGIIDQDWGGISPVQPAEDPSWANPFAAIYGPRQGSNRGEYISNCDEPDGKGGWRHVGITIIPKDTEISSPHVYSTHAGYVSHVGYDSRYPDRGYYVEIQATTDDDCLPNFVTRYQGLIPGSVRVEENEYVPRHKILGLMGSSGGPYPGLTRHLTYVIRYGRGEDPANNNTGPEDAMFIMGVEADDVSGVSDDVCPDNPYIFEEPGLPYFFCVLRKRGDTVLRCLYDNP